MNRLVAAIILLTLSVGISVSGYFYIKNSAYELTSLIEYDKQATVANGQASAERAQKLRAAWEEKEFLLIAILPHSELDDIEINIKNLSEYQQQDMTDEYIKALDECKSRLEHIASSEIPDFKNIF